MTRFGRLCAWAAVAGAAGLSTGPALAEGPSCQAAVRATAGSDEVTDRNVYKVFAVEIDTEEACAKVYVDLATTERLADGTEVKATTHGFRKVSTSTTYKVRYPIARDSTLVSWGFSVAGCVVCGANER